MTRKILFSFPLNVQIRLAWEALSQIEVFIDLVPIVVGDSTLGEWI